uniref:Uncharacterized protein n=2 Tax=Chrysotila carterae TaxID=13221 RepID=A0A7S4B565_CHRCT
MRKMRNGMERKPHVSLFSYVLVERALPKTTGAVAEAEAEANDEWSRVVRKPRIRAAHVIVDLCTADGVVLAKTISKRSAHPMQYRQARKTALGEAWLWKQDEDAVEYLEDDFQ